MYKAILIDDEAHCLRTLEQQLAWVDLEIEVIFKGRSVEEGLQFLNEVSERPDFVFLDIQMGKQNGFDLLQQVDLSEAFVVFTTAFDQYAMKAFKHKASGYLNKPISTDDLEALLLSLVAKPGRKTKSNLLKINTRTGLELIDIKRLNYLSAEGSYTRLFFDDGTEKIISKNLKTLEELISDTDFLRIHAKYMVNKGNVRQVFVGEKPALLLSSSIRLPISRSRKEIVLNLLQGL